MKTIFLLGLLLAAASDLYAQTYIFNPLQEKHSFPASQKLNAKVAAEWADKWVESLLLSSSSRTRNQILDVAGQSLSEKIKEASDLYLKLEPAAAETLLDEAYEQLVTAAPYSNWKKDFQEIVALRWMIAATHGEPSAERVEEAKPFQKDEAFLRLLPLQAKAKLQSYPSEQPALVESVPISASRLFVFGQAETLPLRLQPGTYVVHLVDHSQVHSYTLQVSAAEATWKRVKSTSIGALFGGSEVREAALKTLPKGLAFERVSIAHRNLLTGQLTLLPLTAGRSRAASPKESSATLAGFHAAPMPSSSRLDDPWLNHAVREDEKKSSIFKSPWFWVAATALAGLGGYLTYEGTRSRPTTVTTP